MSDPYTDDDSEFVPPGSTWNTACQATLSNQETGRADWATIAALYPGFGLRGPEASGQDFNANPGPPTLPLAVTQVSFVSPISAARALPDPIFSLVGTDAASLAVGSSARAFRFSSDNQLIDLGRPSRDRLDARGVEPGERLCVLEPLANRLGCTSVTAGGRRLTLHTLPDWRPEVSVTPVTSRTLDIQVSGIGTGVSSLQARLFPADGQAGPAVALTRQADGRYTGRFGPAQLVNPVFEGYIHVWADGSEPRREAVVDFTMGGNPGRRWMRTAPTGDPGRRWMRTAPRANPGRRWMRTAPVISSDGNVIIYTPQAFNEGEFYTVQTVANLPAPQPWLTPVGQAYRLSATANAPSLDAASISVTYLQEDVPPGGERWLRLYHLEGNIWRQLATERSPEYNQLSAPLAGSGVYAVFASVEVEAPQRGYNLISYPIEESLSPGEGLASIAGRYTHIYGYNPAGATSTERWPVYTPNPTVPGYVNTLARLEFGQGYFLYVTEPVVIGWGAGSTAALASAETLTPPSMFYGSVQQVGGAVVQPGQRVTGVMNGVVCGTGETRLVGGQVVYTVAVEAAGTGCGLVGREVVLQVDGERLGVGVWDNSRIQRVDSVDNGVENPKLFLPLLRR